MQYWKTQTACLICPGRKMWTLSLGHLCLVPMHSQNWCTVFTWCWIFDVKMTSPSRCCCLHSPRCKLKSCPACSCLKMTVNIIFGCLCSMKNLHVVMRPLSRTMTNKLSCTLYISYLSITVNIEIGIWWQPECRFRWIFQFLASCMSALLSEPVAMARLSYFGFSATQFTVSTFTQWIEAF